MTQTRDRRHRRRRPGRPDGGAGPRRGRLRGRRLRADGHARRLHDLGHPGVPLPPEVFDEDIERMLARCPGITVHLEHGARPRRHARRAEGAPRRRAADDRRLVGARTWASRASDRPARASTASSSCAASTAASGPTMPAQVIVVGGGDVAMDACRAALRLPGCEHVQGHLPARARGDPGAQGRAARRASRRASRSSTTPSRSACCEVDGELALRCVRTELGEPGEDGRRVADRRPRLRARRPLRPRDPRDRPEGRLRAPRRARADGRATACAPTGTRCAPRDPEGLRRGRRRLRRRRRSSWRCSTATAPRTTSRRFLEGVAEPLPYRTPYATRRVPVAQDVHWEVFPREHQEFHGLGEQPGRVPRDRVDVRRR